MPKFKLNLTFTTTATIEIEADTKEKAIQKWNDGSYCEMDIEPDETLYGGTPWTLAEN